jgi:hypothetical protein
MGCIGCSGCGITAEARSRRGAQDGGCGLPLLSELQVDYRSRSGRSPWEWTGALSNCLLLRGQAVFGAARRALRVVAPPGVPPEWADRVTTHRGECRFAGEHEGRRPAVRGAAGCVLYGGTALGAGGRCFFASEIVRI